MNSIFADVQDAFVALSSEIMDSGYESFPRGMFIKEILCPNIVIADPRKRWVTFNSRKVDIAYAIGELFWYLSKTNLLDSIKYYAPSIGKFSDDKITLNSAYGYLMFCKWGNQIKAVCELLKNDPDSRQAVVLLREPKDIFKKTKDQVCTVSLQFFIRNEKLHLIVNMRSNDLFVGFLYDMFCFTMIQEIMACILNCKLGYYYHVPGSLHIYEKWFDRVGQIKEETAEKFDLGTMSFRCCSEQIWDYISLLCDYEKTIRKSNSVSELKRGFSVYHSNLTDYWKQIFDILLFKSAKKFEDSGDFCDIIINELDKYRNWFFIEYLIDKKESK